MNYQKYKTYINNIFPYSSSSSSLLSQSGQAVLIILLSTLVALTIGLAVTQRSLTEVSNSTRVEQSSRAFSAAEAGIEQALKLGTSVSDSLSNQAGFDVTAGGEVPEISDNGVGLEYPLIGKATFAHFWLRNPANLGDGATSYTHDKFLVYFGNADQPEENSDQLPAIEVNVITYNGSSYVSNRYYYDSNSVRLNSNRFASASCNNPLNTANVYSLNNTNLEAPATSQPFYCKVDVPPTNCASLSGCTAYSGTPILARVRILYSDKDQRVALVPDAPPPSNNFLPPQSVLFDATGTAGDTKRRLRLFTMKNVVPLYLDYAIFSAGPITKQ